MKNRISNTKFISSGLFVRESKSNLSTYILTASLVRNIQKVRPKTRDPSQRRNSGPERRNPKGGTWDSKPRTLAWSLGSKILIKDETCEQDQSSKSKTAILLTFWKIFVIFFIKLFPHRKIRSFVFEGFIMRSHSWKT